MLQKMENVTFCYTYEKNKKTDLEKFLKGVINLSISSKAIYINKQLTAVEKVILLYMYYNKQDLDTALKDLGFNRMFKTRAFRNKEFLNLYKSLKSVRDDYGEYKNVVLSDEEFEILKQELGENLDIMINRLSRYIHDTGKEYKNHYSTIRNWFDKEKLSGNVAKSNNNNLNPHERVYESDEELERKYRKTFDWR